MVKYHMPTRLYFGGNSLVEHGGDIASLGKRALVITDKRSARLSGVEEDLIRIFRENNIEYEIFDGIVENPTLDSVHSGAGLLREMNASLVVGVGGGSPIDAAKAISVAAANNLEGRDIYNSRKIVKAYPIVAIPTTSGTGTEATPFSVITDTGIRHKAGFESPLIFPALSFLDPKYTLSLNADLTRNTGVDALSHLLEGLYSRLRNRLVYPLIYEGVSLVYLSLIPAMEDLGNIEYRERLMRASLYGGIVIAQTSTTLQHAVGYPLTTAFGVSHGLSNGLVMRDIMELYYPAVKAELSGLFSYLDISRDQFYKWLDSLGMTFGYEMTDDFIEKSVEGVLKSGDIPVTPINVTEDIVRKIYYHLKVL